jgi:hypothetical protein
MNCKNILIVRLGGDTSSDSDTEVKKVAELLQEKYEDRKPIRMDYSEASGKIEFKAVASWKGWKSWDEWNPTIGDTGIYVVQEGCGGTNRQGFKEYLHGEAVRKKFAEWFVELAGKPKNLNIRKLCLLACHAVLVEGGKAKPVEAVTEAQEDVYVQHVCRAISEIDKQKGYVLGKLMVAGYSSGVSVVTDKGGIFKATSMHPSQSRGFQRIHPALIKPKPKDMTPFAAGITAYIGRKRIFVLEKGTWTIGKLSEYSDKDDKWLKEFLAQKGS